MATIYVMEAANLFCGDHNPTLSKHLQLSGLRLPSLEENFADHHPGGSPVGIEVAVGVKKLTPSFKLVGWDPDTMVLFGWGQPARHTFTAYGSIRDKRTGTLIEAVAVIEGRLGKVEPDEFKRGELMHHDHAINEVTHYDLTMGGREIFFWDLWTNEWRADGANINGQENTILRIPNTGNTNPGAQIV